MANKAPMKNIMKTGDWTDAECYRIACACQSNSHDLDVWIEVEPDSETNEVVLTFYKDMYTPYWESGFNRFREAFRILFFGHSRMSASTVLQKDVAENFIAVLDQSVKRLSNKK